MNKQITAAELRECADSIYETQQQLLELVGTLKDIAEGLDDQYVLSYQIPHLLITLTENNGYLSRDANLDDWIHSLEQRADEMETEE